MAAHVRHFLSSLRSPTTDRRAGGRLSCMFASERGMTHPLYTRSAPVLERNDARVGRTVYWVLVGSPHRYVTVSRFIVPRSRANVISPESCLLPGRSRGWCRNRRGEAERLGGLSTSDRCQRGSLPASGRPPVVNEQVNRLNGTWVECAKGIRHWKRTDEPVLVAGRVDLTRHRSIARGRQGHNAAQLPTPLHICQPFGLRTCSARLRMRGRERNAARNEASNQEDEGCYTERAHHGLLERAERHLMKTTPSTLNPPALRCQEAHRGGRRPGDDAFLGGKGADELEPESGRARSRGK